MLRLQFRRVLGSLIAVIAIVVVGNNLLFAQIRSPQNASIAQMIPGWTRQFKPLLYDHVKPQAIAFGASWVRDAFDPEMMERLTGEKFFNFGVSGGSSFESFRLAQSAFSTHPPERIYLHLESFFDAPRATRLRHGFDERILHLDETGEPTRFVGFYRALKINFSGSALGFGYRFLTAKFALARGAQREDVFRHSPFGLPPVRLKQPKATFQAISASDPRVVLRAGRIARPNRPTRPLKASLDAFSDTPFLSPALDLADLGGFLVMCTLLRQADRAAR